jgi:hypothetical protein
MMDKLFDNPDIASLVVVTTMLIVVWLVKWRFKAYVLLWRGTLISYMVFITFILMGVVYEHCHIGPFYRILFHTVSAVLLIPSALIYSFFPGAIKMCPSNFDEVALNTISFLFYSFIFLGIMKVIKRRKETKAAEKKQDNKLEKQTPTEPET